MKPLVQKENSVKTFLKDNPSLFWLISDLRALLATYLGKNSPSTEKYEGFEKPFLMIVGSGRSGNTLLRRLLMERYNIYIPPETYVLPNIADYRIRGKPLRWGSLVDLVVSSFEYHPEFETFDIDSLRCFAAEAKTWDKNRHNITSLLEGLYCHFAIMADAESDWIGDKTPLNTLHLGRIQRVLPKARYVYLLRDGVDVTTSYVSSGIYTHIEEAGRRWVRSHKSWKAFQKKLPPDRCLEVRYEELVSDPEKHISKIAHHFGIPERKSIVQLESLLGDVGKRPHHQNVTRAPSVDSIGKGRKTLSNEEARRLRPILSNYLQKCGYEPL